MAHGIRRRAGKDLARCAAPDAAEWRPFPHAKGEPVGITLRAVFEIRADTEAKKHGVWTGRVVSKAVKCTAYDSR